MKKIERRMEKDGRKNGKLKRGWYPGAVLRVFAEDVDLLQGVLSACES